MAGVARQPVGAVAGRCGRSLLLRLSAMRRDTVRVPVSLLVVTGPPGVGKSTIAALVADRLPQSALIEGDAFFAFLRQGAIEPWLPESQTQNEIVTEAAAVATGRFARDYATVYDGVMGPWF